MKKVIKIINFAEYLITGLLFVAALTVLFLNVLFRRIPSIPAFNFAEEFQRYCSVWITFVGMSICAEQDSHVGVDIVYQLQKKGMAKKVIRILCMLTAAVFCTFFTIGCWNYTMMAFKNHTLSPVMGLPMWIVYISLPIGSGLSTIQYVIKTVEGILKPASAYEEKEEIQDVSEINLLELN